MPNRHILVNFGNAKRLCQVCLMTQKHCWNYFALLELFKYEGPLTNLQPLQSTDVSETKILNSCKQDSDQDSYFLDQDWSRTQKNLSPNTSVSKMNGVKFFKSDPTIFFKTPKLIVLKFISCLNPKSDHWYQPSGYIQSTQERNF